MNDNIAVLKKKVRSLENDLYNIKDDNDEQKEMFENFTIFFFIVHVLTAIAVFVLYALVIYKL